MQRLWGPILASSMLAVLTSEAWAQDDPATVAVDEPPADEEGFGDRSAFVLSVENIFGVQSLKLGSGDDDDNELSIDSKPLFPFFWADLGFHHVHPSGLTLGANLGAAVITLNEEDPNDDDIGIVRLRPRIGYAGSPKAIIGYWVRAGPSVSYFVSGDTSTWLLAFGLEVYGVVMPVEHVGIVVGPSADIHIIGRTDDGDPAKLQTFGMSIGILGEF